MPLQELQTPQLRSNSAKKAASGVIEDFKIIYGIKSEKRIQQYSGVDQELINEQYQREQRDRDMERRAKRTFHKHERSTSRASNSSRKAKDEIEIQESWIEENKQNINAYKGGVDAIQQAAVETNRGKVPTGEGIDLVRQRMKEAQ